MCQCFADVKLSDASAVLPENDVPEHVVNAGVGMETVADFAPSFLGPGSLRDPAAAEPQEQEEVQAEEQHSDDEHCDGHAREHASASKELATETLIGLDESGGVDPVTQFKVFKTKLEIVNEEAEKLMKLELQRRRIAEVSAEAAVASAMEISAAEAGHVTACIDLRDVAKSMGPQFVERMEAAATDSEQKKTPSKLVVQAGKPLDMFAPEPWSLCFTEFFYGDCVPNLARPAPLSMKYLFDYLMDREELEYHLPGDADDPNVPNGCYRAPSRSRWDRPEFAAVFANTLQGIEILQSTRGFFRGSTADKWKHDLQKIANSKAQDFQQFEVKLQSASDQSIIGMMRQAKELPGVHAVLKHLLMHTANVPLTERINMTIRHHGFGLNLHDGPLTLFLTVNWADTYSPLTLLLLNAAGDPLGTRSVNLFDDSPVMQNLQAMHMLVATHPMVQANLFLLMNRILHTELLCTQGVFLGRRTFNSFISPPIEDDWASTSEPGIANFVRSGLKPLEAQGRGFTHGHGKYIGVPQERRARLKELFAVGAPEHGSDAFGQLLQRMRDAFIGAASTLQLNQPF